MKRNRLSLLVSLVALAMAPLAKADTFDFSYNASGGVSGSGTLEGTFIGSGTWVITSANGSFNDGSNSGSISLISNPVAPGAATSPSGYFTYDDLVYPFASPDAVLDFDGLLFSFGGMELNFWDGGFPYVEGWAENNGNSGAGTFTITPVNVSTPEPESLLLLGTGLTGLAVRMSRRAGTFGKLRGPVLNS